MNPEIEPMLEEAFDSLAPKLDAVGRVDLEPDYESGLTREDVPAIRRELEALLAAVKPERSAIASHAGQTLAFDSYPTLKRFVRRIALHAGKSEDAFVEVVPPGNWI